MYQYYYINKNVDANGFHEIHATSCPWLPQSENLIAIGYFDNCHQALNKAKMLYPQFSVDLCYFCCNACHTT